jgi:hypothetical protein
MRYRLLSLADGELAEAAQWYEAQAAGLGQKFPDEFETVMSRVRSEVSARRRCVEARLTWRVPSTQSAGDES